jgi:hypothetical protein
MAGLVRRRGPELCREITEGKFGFGPDAGGLQMLY